MASSSTKIHEHVVCKKPRLERLRSEMEMFDYVVILLLATQIVDFYESDSGFLYEIISRNGILKAYY